MGMPAFTSKMIDIVDLSRGGRRRRRRRRGRRGQLGDKADVSGWIDVAFHYLILNS